MKTYTCNRVSASVEELKQYKDFRLLFGFDDVVLYLLSEQDEAKTFKMEKKELEKIEKKYSNEPFFSYL
ncbi:hypothetical protein TwortDSMZ_175 [Staphylococcus phage Twort]|uniref:ORF190 n=2 Tax=Staphylococcus phage Twort (strain DSM 17442 / HER 48) TaxID=2908167 RepID=Q4Z969_BPTWO|nr:ORF190 [Staphylococcus phage Twort]AAX92454.1 ORF190 [Staphylococcus phage Twort]QIW89173.1 hypothetical protein TwortDSMZ_175 [Staphylococcus phage Twort]